MSSDHLIVRIASSCSWFALFARTATLAATFHSVGAGAPKILDSSQKWESDLRNFKTGAEIALVFPLLAQDQRISGVGDHTGLVLAPAPTRQSPSRAGQLDFSEGGPMYQHILLPTDGSAASEAAIHSALRFAKDIGAKVSGLYVIPEYHLFTYKTEMLEDTREQFAKDSNLHALKYLSSIEHAAKDLGVPCDTLQMASDHPYEAIIQAARDLQCDLIAMASHGRRGLKGVLLGSETQKVLAHSAIPVLVFR
jgi:nucleotide-binding universal stress UspA family protein